MTFISRITPLDFHWPTLDPFLFCAHHLDFYPEGNAQQGPDASLETRHLGHDFDLLNNWKMYHGYTVPGFPVHPHRGFETVTIVLEGLVDHFDSGGGSGRYGGGDVQWMTAGAGLQHAEMFPLVNRDKPNPLHLFQVWLNLPSKDKFVSPFYKMLWNETIPKVTIEHAQGVTSQVTVIAGSFQGIKAPAPAPDSWAAKAENHVEILIMRIAKGQSIHLPLLSATANRSLYFYQGGTLRLGEGLGEGQGEGQREGLGEGQEKSQQLKVAHMALLPAVDLVLTAEVTDAFVLLLAGEPIGETVVQYGPFVMNTKAEIQQAYDDYGKTHFGGWPWPKPDPVFDREQGRIANYDDGTTSRPPV